MTLAAANFFEYRTMMATADKSLSGWLEVSCIKHCVIISAICNVLYI